MKAIIGKKIGMTQIFAKNGIATPVTVIEAGPCIVTQVKTMQSDGYDAVQLGFGDVKPRRISKPQAGHFKKAGVENKKVLKEFKTEGHKDLTLGQVVKCDSFAVGDIVDVAGISKGHGFSGVIARWNTHRLKMTHGTGPVHRSVGSTGANSDPSRVFKNKKMAGQWGNENVTIQNLEIAGVDLERNLLLIKGSIPGNKNSIVTVYKAVKA